MTKVVIGLLLAMKFLTRAMKRFLTIKVVGLLPLPPLPKQHLHLLLLPNPHLPLPHLLIQAAAVGVILRLPH
jgi:hypothetical protein